MRPPRLNPIHSLSDTKICTLAITSAGVKANSCTARSNAHNPARCFAACSSSGEIGCNCNRRSM
eukprot:scaffold182030_cov28-Tisochrysis_lutea.AAC.1